MFLDGSEKCARSTIQTLVAPDCMANHAKKNARSIHSLKISIILTADFLSISLLETLELMMTVEAEQVADVDVSNRS